MKMWIRRRPRWYRVPPDSVGFRRLSGVKGELDGSNQPAAEAMSGADFLFLGLFYFCFTCFPNPCIFYRWDHLRLSFVFFPFHVWRSFDLKRSKDNWHLNVMKVLNVRTNWNCSDLQVFGWFGRSQPVGRCVKFHWILQWNTWLNWVPERERTGIAAAAKRKLKEKQKLENGFCKWRKASDRHQLIRLALKMDIIWWTRGRLAHEPVYWTWSDEREKRDRLRLKI